MTNIEYLRLKPGQIVRIDHERGGTYVVLLKRWQPREGEYLIGTILLIINPTDREAGYLSMGEDYILSSYLEQTYTIIE